MQNAENVHKLDAAQSPTWPLIVSPPGCTTSHWRGVTKIISVDKNDKNCLPWPRLFGYWKTSFRLIIYSHSSTNPENLAKISLVNFETICLTKIVIKRNRSRTCSLSCLLSAAWRRAKQADTAPMAAKLYAPVETVAATSPPTGTGKQTDTSVFQQEGAIWTSLTCSATYECWQRGTARIRPPHAAVQAAAIDRYILPVEPTAANLQQRVCCCGPMLGQTDGRTLYRFIDPVHHTMQEVPFSYYVPATVTADGRLSPFRRLGSRCRLPRDFLFTFSIVTMALSRSVFLWNWHVSFSASRTCRPLPVTLRTSRGHIELWVRILARRFLSGYQCSVW